MTRLASAWSIVTVAAVGVVLGVFFLAAVVQVVVLALASLGHVVTRFVGWVS